MTSRSTLLLFLICFCLAISAMAQQKPNMVKSLKVTILSTMLADAGIGEWGFCALIEADGHKILFDTGARPETVLTNISDLNIDLSDIEEVFISHSHYDHTGGLMRLKEELSLKNSKAISKAHIGEGAFYSRPGPMGVRTQFMLSAKEQYERSGGKFIVYNEPQEIYPGVWITGPVPRVNDERNYGAGKVILPDGTVKEDNVPEDQSMVFNTDEGLVIVSGCGHSGIINTIEYARQKIGARPVSTLIGGFHLFNLPDEKIIWTAGKLKEYGAKNFIGAHCTGINAVFDIRQQLGLSRSNVIVGAVGSYFESGKGISAGGAGIAK